MCMLSPPNRTHAPPVFTTEASSVNTAPDMSIASTYPPQRPSLAARRMHPTVTAERVPTYLTQRSEVGHRIYRQGSRRERRTQWPGGSMACRPRYACIRGVAGLSGIVGSNHCEGDTTPSCCRYINPAGGRLLACHCIHRPAKPPTFEHVRRQRLERYTVTPPPPTQ